jgi:CHAT domain-containing protein
MAYAKKYWLVIAGVAIALWLVFGRNQTVTTRAPSTNSMGNDVSIATQPPAPLPTPVPVAQSDSTAAQERVEKYPLLLSPESVAAGQEFRVVVSLTEQKLSNAQILNGDSTADGKLVFTLPATQQQNWKLDVTLAGDGLVFSQGTGMSSIELPRHGNATAATFVVKASPAAAASGVIHLVATFGYNNAYLAFISRDIHVTPIAPQQAAEAPSGPMATTAASIGNTSGVLDNSVPKPDLLVFIRDNNVFIFSPYFHLPPGKLPDLTGFPEWLAQHSPASAGRGSQLLAPDRVSEHAKGFGEVLYQHYAPDVFKRAFWATVAARGKQFRTIQIESDQPDIPWELMRPVREDGTDERDFLGLDYSVARWDTSGGAMTQNPPYSENISHKFVIAPHYTGNRSLDGEAEETQKLALLSGYTAIHGNRNAVKALFQNPPQGIVHFAGHGELDAANNEFEILLEDGALDVTSWRSMAENPPLSHTFFFFNACDVGNATRSGNFVDGFGPAVLSKGAIGYIGALWPVNDQVAARFSVHFYQLVQDELVNGPVDVGAALERTRREVYKDTGNPTALAYVLYGDTNLKFIK